MSEQSVNTPSSFLDHLLLESDEEVSILTTADEEEATLEDDGLVTLGSKDRNTRIRACIMTFFPTDDNEKWLLPETWLSDTDRGTLMVWCGQFELCPETDRLHGHIYVEFNHKSPKRFEWLRKLIARITGKPGNIAKTKRLTKMTRGNAVNYVLKPDGWIGGAKARFIWPHNKLKVEFNPETYANRASKKRKVKDSREDVDEKRRLYIETKPRWWLWEQVLHENDESKALLCTCSWGKTYHAGRYAEIKRRDIDNVVLLYGAGGTGKTTFAHSWDIREDEDAQERYYRRNPDDGAFWGGGRTAYKGQRVVHLEEYCGQEKLARFKELCDIGKPGPNVNVKNGGVALNHDSVIITSNHHPAAWYRHHMTADPKQFNPFWRRVTQVWFFPSHRPDGTLNVPDDTHAPYYVDQTDEWKSMEGCWDTCLAHADQHWPLRDADASGANAPGFYQPP